MAVRVPHVNQRGYKGFLAHPCVDEASGFIVCMRMYKEKKVRTKLRFLPLCLKRSSYRIHMLHFGRPRLHLNSFGQELKSYHDELCIIEEGRRNALLPLPEAVQSALQRYPAKAFA